MNFWAKIEKTTYKRNQFKAQLVQMDQRGPKLTKWIKVDRMGPNWTEVDLIWLNKTEVNIIGPNSNCLIFKEKLSLINFRKKIIHYVIIIK